MVFTVTAPARQVNETKSPQKITTDRPRILKNRAVRFLHSVCIGEPEPIARHAVIVFKDVLIRRIRMAPTQGSLDAYFRARGQGWERLNRVRTVSDIKFCVLVISQGVLGRPIFVVPLFVGTAQREAPDCPLPIELVTLLPRAIRSNHNSSIGMNFFSHRNGFGLNFETRNGTPIAHRGAWHAAPEKDSLLWSRENK